ncbi:MAG: hypothetical protein HZA31_02830 [Opitutae bacterium]|nr:hypothetical protein [Opitutae bacterium]
MTPWRQTWLLTGLAAAIFLVVRSLPTGTNLSHMDFRPEGKSLLEWCDPANPQFISVLQVRSPVTLAVLLSDAQPLQAGNVSTLRLELKTSSGKPITPGDLAVVHTRKLHLLVIDPSLSDYQHLHPHAGARPGTWEVSFTPRGGGLYRVFADFTPVATGRSLYAAADLPVTGTPLPAAPDAARQRREGEAIFTLHAPESMRVGRPVDLRLEVRDAHGARPDLTPVMGAPAHLVAFDEQRTGFAHLHPRDPTPAPETPNAAGTSVVLNFALTVPRAGRYLIWAQCAPHGIETLVPFWIEVGGRGGDGAPQ